MSHSHQHWSSLPDFKRVNFEGLKSSCDITGGGVSAKDTSIPSTSKSQQVDITAAAAAAIVIDAYTVVAWWSYVVTGAELTGCDERKKNVSVLSSSALLLLPPPPQLYRTCRSHIDSLGRYDSQGPRQADAFVTLLWRSDRRYLRRQITLTANHLLISVGMW